MKKLWLKKLWVDDFRVAPDGSWVEARKVEQAIRLLATQRFSEISLDHDIENRPDDETFKPVAYFIGEKYQNDAFFADDLEVTVHSDNPVGAKEIIAILNDYGIVSEWKPYTSHKGFKQKYGLEET